MSKGIDTEKFDKVEVTSAEALRSWLADNHGRDESVWLVTYKASEQQKYVSREEVLDELISFGWIDGVRRKLDDSRTMQLISRRRVQHWAKSYKDRATRLIEEGRMAPPGLASIEEGKASGLWNFMDDVDELIWPDDLKAALDAEPAARAHFAAFAPSAQRFTLRWIKLAKSEKTRRARIDTTVSRAAKGAFVPGVRMDSKDDR
ncbi:MAG: YdeI/OmpD-associated family protein [Pseudomonadota bacterium]